MTAAPGQASPSRTKADSSRSTPTKPTPTASRSTTAPAFTSDCARHIWHLIDTPLAGTPACEIAPGVYRLEDEHHVYAVPSTSTDRIHQVTVNTRTGAMRCDGPCCHGRTCSHQRRVLKARAGF